MTKENQLLSESEIKEYILGLMNEVEEKVATKGVVFEDLEDYVYMSTGIYLEVKDIQDSNDELVEKIAESVSESVIDLLGDKKLRRITHYVDLDSDVVNVKVIAEIGK